MHFCFDALSPSCTFMPFEHMHRTVIPCGRDTGVSTAACPPPALLALLAERILSAAHNTYVVHSWPDLPGVAGKDLGVVKRDAGTTHAGGLAAGWCSQWVCPPHSWKAHMPDVCGILSFTDSPEWA